MKKLVFTLLLIPFFFVSCYTISKVTLKDIPELPYSEKPVIAVLNFQNKTGDRSMNPLMENITGSMIS